MNSRLARLLLRLYPRWIRDRYGDELLQLQDELRAGDDLSRPRLLRDMLTGALAARPARERFVASAALVAICGVAAVGVIVSSAGSSRPAVRVYAQAPSLGDGVYHPPTAPTPVPRSAHPAPSVRSRTPHGTGNGVYYPPTTTGATPATPGPTPHATGDGVYHPPRATGATPLTPHPAPYGHTPTSGTG